MQTDCLGLERHHLRRIGRLAAALACLLGWTAGVARAGDEERAAAASSGAGGRVQGTVAVGPELSSRKIRFSLYPDPARAAIVQPQPGHEQELQNVVIYFEPSPALSAAGASKPERPAMRQEGMAFLPHVLAVSRGTTVDFPNGDGIFHNVFSLSKAAEFDLGRYTKGSTKSVRFDKPGIVKVFCHIHSDMSGVILVLDSPYFAIPDARGQYTISGVPPGEYTVVGWHERARPLRRTVRIQPGRTAVADFSIPLTEPAAGD
jgi:plastocyanin